MIVEIVVDQPLARAGYFPESIRWARVGDVCAFVVEAVYQSVSGVTGLSGNAAKPYPYIALVSSLLMQLSR